MHQRCTNLIQSISLHTSNTIFFNEMIYFVLIMLVFAVPPKITPFSFAADPHVGERASIQCVVVKVNYFTT